MNKEDILTLGLCMLLISLVYVYLAIWSHLANQNNEYKKLELYSAQCLMMSGKYYYDTQECIVLKSNSIQIFKQGQLIGHWN